MKIRHAVTTVLNAETKIGLFLGENLETYINNLTQNFAALLKQIWLTDKKSAEWKIAASDWLIYAFPVFACDVNFINFNEMDRQIAIKYIHLIRTLEALINDPNFEDLASIYNLWLFQHLYEYWLYNPKNKELLANIMAESLYKTIEEIKKTKSELNNISEEDFYYWATMSLPEDLQGVILQNPVFDHKFDDKFVVEQRKIEVTRHQFEIVETDNLYQYLKEHPQEWLRVFDTAIRSESKTDCLGSLIKFMEEYMRRYSVDSLPSEWRWCLASLIWKVSPEQRLALLNFLKKI